MKTILLFFLLTVAALGQAVVTTDTNVMIHQRDATGKNAERNILGSANVGKAIGFGPGGVLAGLSAYDMLPAGSALQFLRRNAGNNGIEWVASSLPAVPSGRVAYGHTDNSITSEGAFLYNPTTDTLSVPFAVFQKLFLIEEEGLGSQLGELKLLSSLTANRSIGIAVPDADVEVTIPGTLTVAGTNVVNGWSDGIKQTFNPDGTTAGVNVGTHAADPSALVNGDMWYNSTSNELKARINGTSVALGAGGGGSAALTSTYVGFGSGSNEVTGESALHYNATTDTLTVPSLAAVDINGTSVRAASFGILDSFSDDHLLLTVGEDLSATRTLSFLVQNANRTITFSNSMTVAGIDVANNWADGVKQSFNPNGTNAGLNAGSHTADPASLANGDIWYNSTTNELKVRVNGSSSALGNVLAANVYNNDNRLIRSDGTGRGTQATGITVTDDDDVTGVNDFSAATASVGDDAYNATTWNGSTAVPTKNAIRDKIETMGFTTGSFTGTGTYASSNPGIIYAGTMSAAATVTLNLSAGHAVEFLVNMTGATLGDRTFSWDDAAQRIGYAGGTITSIAFEDAGWHSILFLHDGLGLRVKDSDSPQLDLTSDVTGILPVANGGTGRNTGTTAYALIATGTTATGAQQSLAAGATTEILVGGGAAALPVWTTATGSGAPVRATSPTLTTPNLGTPSAVTLTNGTGLPIATGVSGLGTGVATALATPSSANLRSAVSDEAGTGPLMFTRTGVRRTIYVNAGAMIPRTTAGAATATVELATNDVMFDAFDFDQTTEEGVGFWLTLPSAWDAGTVTARFHWTAASGSGTVKWDIAARSFADDDAIDQAMGTEQTASADTLLATGDMHISGTTPALTVGGTPAANRPIYWQVTRDVGGDTLSGDARLLGVTIEYTESTTEPSAQ